MKLEGRSLRWRKLSSRGKRNRIDRWRSIETEKQEGSRSRSLKKQRQSNANNFYSSTKGTDVVQDEDLPEVSDPTAEGIANCTG